MNASALGYFIMPILNIALAFFIFNEKLDKLQWLAVILAALGVLWAIYIHGSLPFIAKSW